MMDALHAEITADGQRVVLFPTGPNLPLIAKGFSFLTPTITPTEPPDAVNAPLSWPLVVQLATQYPGVFMPGPRLQQWMAGQIMARMAPVDTTRPPELTGVADDGTAMYPRPYQWEGACMLAGTGRGFLFDDAGTGKTITAILAVLKLRAAGVVPVAGPVVVVCPASVQDEWVRAFRRWSTLTVVAWRGTPDRRDRLAGTADVYVATYGTARNDAVYPRRATATHPKREAGRLWKLNPSVVIVDECHALKNRDSKQSQTVRAFGGRARCVFALSGTPITHTVRDLWPNMAMIDPAGYPGEERFTNRYVQTTTGDYQGEALGLQPWRQAEFDQALLGQYRRKAKADVLTELPPKVYSVREVDLPAEYRKAYDDLEAEMLAELPGEEIELSAMTQLANLELLCRLSCAAADVYTVTVEVEDPLNPGQMIEVERVRAKLRAPSWKADELVAVLDERPGQQVAVFAPSRQMIDVAHEMVAKAGYRCALVVGGQTPAERQANVDAFQRGDADVILVTTSAGGVGLTLTAASVVVFLQRPWSFVQASQAEDRCHRIGSEIHDSIEIIDIVAKDTVDARMRDVIRIKAGALAELLKDPRIVREVLGGA